MYILLVILFITILFIMGSLRAASIVDNEDEYLDK